LLDPNTVSEQWIWVDLKGNFRAINQTTLHLFVWRHRGQVKFVALHDKQERMGGRSFASGDRSGWVVSATSRPLYPRGWTTVPILEAGCSSWPFWTGVENLAPNLVRTPDRPDRSESLYGIGYRSHSIREGIRIFTARTMGLWVQICSFNVWNSRQVTAAFSNPLYLPHTIQAFLVNNHRSDLINLRQNVP
jgi:hypothetical protein